MVKSLVQNFRELCLNDSNEKQCLLNELNYTFVDSNLLQAALTHRSCGFPNNERLEFLGDSILNFTITEALYQRFPKASEGDLSALRAKLVSGETLAKIAITLNLGSCLYLGEGERKSGGSRRPSILADAVESLIGAIHMDSGLESAKQCIHTIYQKRLDTVTLNVSAKDAKTQLQEWLQGRKKPLPQYTLTHTTGEAHDQRFSVQCSVVLVSQTTEAIATNRKEAEKNAAKQMLEILEAKYCG